MIETMFFWVKFVLRPFFAGVFDAQWLNYSLLCKSKLLDWVVSRYFYSNSCNSDWFGSKNLHSALPYPAAVSHTQTLGKDSNFECEWDMRWLLTLILKHRRDNAPAHYASISVFNLSKRQLHRNAGWWGIRVCPLSVEFYGSLRWDW